jgi:phytoene/squalene synthetase
MRPVSVDHYENFPVASVLCPPAMRPAVAAIYHFARTADDIADEGDAPAASAWPTWRPTAPTSTRRWPAAPPRRAGARVFGPLAHGQAAPPAGALLHDLLDAFEQDVRNPPYPDRAASCWTTAAARPTRSAACCCTCTACTTRRSLQQADAICSALQLINFWQDLSVDLPRGRHYVPRGRPAAATAVTREDAGRCSDSPAQPRAWCATCATGPAR